MNLYKFHSRCPMVREEDLQLFDSTFSAFLTARLEASWGDETQKIKNWLDDVGQD